MSIALSTHSEFMDRLGTARAIELGAYCLGPSMVRALEAAADRGAAVRVRLEATPYGSDAVKRAGLNAQTVQELNAHGVDAQLVDDRGKSHVKAAICDGVAWLDDRNFPAHPPDLIVRDDEAADAAAVHEAIEGRPAGTARLAFTKAEALDLEAATIAGSPGDVDIASESFSTSSVSVALQNHLRAHDRVRLVVSERALHDSPLQRKVVARFARMGAEVRVAFSTDKLAVCDSGAWIGSANATYPIPGTAQTSEWGLQTRTPDGIAAIRHEFESSWADAKPFAGTGSA